MLSVEEVRRLIGDETLTDAEVTEIRDAFQILGEIIFEQWLSERKAPALQGETPVKMA
jgi:hypothetical protein